jgi:small-conductance mechanosensitive channel
MSVRGGRNPLGTDDMTVNLLAILLAAISSMIVGTIWFNAHVFGNRWQAITGVDPNKPKRPALVYTGSFVSALVTATVLALAVSCALAVLGGSRLLVALAAAGILWLGFTAATTAVHYLFEGRGIRLFLINSGHQLLTVLVMAVIVGLLG